MTLLTDSPNNFSDDPWLQAISRFLEHGGRFSKNTRETYGRSLRKFAAFARSRGAHDPGQIELSMLDPYPVELAQRGLAAGSIRLEISALRSFIKWLGTGSDYPSLPKDWQLKAALPLPYTSPSPLSSTSRLDQGTILADLHDRMESLGKRNRAIFMLSSLVGLRASEIGKLRGSHLVQTLRDGGWSARIPGNRGQSRDVPLVEAVFAALTAYLEDTARSPGSFSGHLFLAEDPAVEARGTEGLSRWTVAKVIKDTGRALGLEVTPRSLRHAFGVGFLQQGGDVGQLQHLLGHESLASTEAYVRTAELADARETLERHVEHLESICSQADQE